jgi:DNA topoisomerase-3
MPVVRLAGVGTGGKTHFARAEAGGIHVPERLENIRGARMPEQIVITEKASQARDVQAAVGGRYGPILPAEGHLFDLVEPEEVLPAWKRWTAVLLRPPELYGTKPASGGNKAARLKAIRAALRSAGQVWLATDCDREGQLIGQEILEHYGYRGVVMRVMFTAQDPQTIRDAFVRAKPNADYARLYAAAVARRQADQIYNLSLTRTATVTLAPGARTVLGVGRVKTPTLAIVCQRELEIRAFVPQAYFEVVATAHAEAGQFRMRHAPKERLLKRADANAIAAAAEGFEGPLTVRVEDKRQGPPRLFDLPALQKLCGARFGWSAARTLEVAQALYDGQGKKIITYPRAETRYLPESLIPDVPRIIKALRVGRAFHVIPVPEEPVIRRGASGVFHDKGLAGASHHAVIPNVNTVGDLPGIWPRLSGDERRLFDVIARAYLAAMMPDYRYRQTTIALDVQGHPFGAAGRQPLNLGWRAAFPDWQPAEERGEDAQRLPALRHGEVATLRDAAVEDKETRPPPRYNEGTLIEAMQNAWRFVADAALRERLKEAKGIGTPATRAEIIRGLKAQDFLVAAGKHIVPTERGLTLFAVLQRADPTLVDPGMTAQMERLLDAVLVGEQEMMAAIDAVCAQASRIIGRLREGAIPAVVALLTAPAVGDRRPGPARKRFGAGPPRPKQGPTRDQAYRAVADQRASATKTARSFAADSIGRVPTTKAGRRRRAPDRDAAGAGTGALSTPGDGPRRVERRTADAEGGSRRSDIKHASQAAAETDPSRPESETPLHIPFGNKATALLLGARYRAGGWYAPPGVDLSGFRERGWL